MGKRGTPGCVSKMVISANTAPTAKKLIYYEN
jgi:hypothetical protein